MTLNVFKNDIYNFNYNNKIWFVFSSVLGSISSDILTNNVQSLEYNIMLIMYLLFKISYIFDIDLDKAWLEWKHKAYKKQYSYIGYSSSHSSSYSSNVNI